MNASPIADMASFFLALNSKLLLVSGDTISSLLKSKPKGRDVLLKDFFLGYKTLDKKPEEIILSVSFCVVSSFDISRNATPAIFLSI